MYWRGGCFAQVTPLPPLPPLQLQPSLLPSLRYIIQCPGDRLLAHSIVAHDLEPRQPCPSTGTDECLDNVIIPFDMYGQAVQTTCGQEVDTSQFHQDGTQTLVVEFNANRRAQSTGFELFAWCVQPFELDRRRRDVTGWAEEEVESFLDTPVSLCFCA